MDSSKIICLVTLVGILASVVYLGMQGCLGPGWIVWNETPYVLYALIAIRIGIEIEDRYLLAIPILPVVVFDIALVMGLGSSDAIFAPILGPFARIALFVIGFPLMMIYKVIRIRWEKKKDV